MHYRTARPNTAELLTLLTARIGNKAYSFSRMTVAVSYTLSACRYYPKTARISRVSYGAYSRYRHVQTPKIGRILAQLRAIYNQQGETECLREKNAT